MSWLGESGEPFAYRVPISVPVDTGTSHQVEFTVPPGWDAFWESNAGSFPDSNTFRITDADGETLITFQTAIYVGASRQCTIRMAAHTLVSDACNLRWFYWSHSSAVSVSTTVASSSPKDGYVTVLDTSGGPSVAAVADQLGATTPSQYVVKGSGGKQFVFWRVPLTRYPTRFYGRFEYEEIDSVAFAVYDGATDESATMVDLDLIRVFYDAAGACWVRTLWQADDGTDDDYTLRLTVDTTLGRTITSRIRGEIQDLTE